MKKILIILTSHEDMENTSAKTGLWLGEFTDPYYEFIDKGYEVTLASPAGGEPPIDPLSKLTKNISGANRRFQKDEKAQEQFRNTLKLSEVDASQFDGLFIPGGHGPVWDLADSKKSGELIVDFLNAKKPVASVCHGPAALLKAAEIEPGLLEGKKLTGFTNTEEVLALRSRNVPYKLETRLKELGADFHSATIPFLSHVQRDGLLITGQNPLSAGPTARSLIEALETG